MAELTSDFGFETARLVVQSVNDSLDDRALHADTAAVLSPAVTAFLPVEMQVTGDRVEADRWLAAVAQEGSLLTLRSRQGVLLGFLILNPGDSGDIMLGYLLAEHAWGQGYATELVRGLVAALHSTGLTGVVIGGVSPDNAASARVLLKSGFRERPDRGPGGSVFYALNLSGN